MCRFENFNAPENCDLFKRSFTTLGIGYTFNNVKEEVFIKEHFRNTKLSPRIKGKTFLMKSAKSIHSLREPVKKRVENSTLGLTPTPLRQKAWKIF